MINTGVTQLILPVANDVITVHCFFNCKHVTQSVDPQRAHNLMEQHYTEKHSQQIERICGRGENAMTVYVDELFNTRSLKSGNWKYDQSCHMKADTEEELHAMAAQIGLRREWCQKPTIPAERHYDLTASKRVLAIRYGAVGLTWREMVAFTQKMRENQQTKG